jgi:hypothetical protein
VYRSIVALGGFATAQPIALRREHDIVGWTKRVLLSFDGGCPLVAPIDERAAPVRRRGAVFFFQARRQAVAVIPGRGLREGTIHLVLGDAHGGVANTQHLQLLLESERDSATVHLAAVQIRDHDHPRRVLPGRRIRQFGDQLSLSERFTLHHDLFHAEPCQRSSGTDPAEACLGDFRIKWIRFLGEVGWQRGLLLRLGEIRTTDDRSNRRVRTPHCHRLVAELRQVQVRCLPERQNQ